MLVRASFSQCRRRREQIALRLDGALSEVEAAGLDAHLAGCVECRRYGADLAATTQLLRIAPLEEPEFPFVLPRDRRLHRLTVQAASVAAALVAVAGVSGVFGNIRGDHLSPPGAATTIAPARLTSVSDDLRMLRNTQVRQQTRRVPVAV